MCESIPGQCGGVQTIETEHQGYPLWKKLGVVVVVEGCVQFNGEEVRKAREVLKAVRQFNLRKVAKLLDVNVPQPPTWGGRSRNATSEDPAVSLRRLVK